MHLLGHYFGDGDLDLSPEIGAFQVFAWKHLVYGWHVLISWSISVVLLATIHIITRNSQPVKQLTQFERFSLSALEMQGSRFDRIGCLCVSPASGQAQSGELDQL
jgi:hypothetical protein